MKYDKMLVEIEDKKECNILKELLKDRYKVALYAGNTKEVKLVVCQSRFPSFFGHGNMDKTAYTLNKKIQIKIGYVREKGFLSYLKRHLRIKKKYYAITFNIHDIDFTTCTII